MKTKKAIFFLSVFLSYIPVLAQVDTAWVRRYNGPGNGGDGAYGMAVDDYGNVYVTGSSAGQGTSFDLVTIKYHPDGDTDWVARYDSAGGLAIVLGDSGNVYVTGAVSGGTEWDNYLTIKYFPNGDTAWVRRYNGPGNHIDWPWAIAVDNLGNVYVTGQSYGGLGTGYDYATIKYYPNGDTAWVRRYNDGSNDVSVDLVLDLWGNIYATGNSGGAEADYATIKYYSNGDTAWVRTYNGPYSFSDSPTAMAVDDSGNVYVTGTTKTGDYNDYLTIKYFTNGDTAWVRTYDGPGKLYDVARAIVLDFSGNVYVTGESYGSGTNYDYATIKYTPNGDTLWVRRYNGLSNHSDNARVIAMDNLGSVYVTGRSYSYPELEGYATIKYSSDGDSVWASRYNGPGNSYDQPFAIVVDDSGNVYVTGMSEGGATGFDYATIKYIQFNCTAKPGDANSDNNVLLSDIVTIINFLFKSQPAPNPLCRGDANADGNVLLPDIVYLINFIFKSGSVPQKSRECCL